jgi:HrpA-like RNA helicase
MLARQDRSEWRVDEDLLPVWMHAELKQRVIGSIEPSDVFEEPAIADAKRGHDTRAWASNVPPAPPPTDDTPEYVDPAIALIVRSAPGRSSDAAVLPIEQHRATIVAAIATQRVTCIQGETGCGKSSMVPRYIVEDPTAPHHVRVVVTQPRRIAAVTLAKRVAEQLGEPLGQSVGYRIGQGDHVDSAATKILFVTVGYFLHHLAHRHGNLNKFTHVVLDEVHERSMDSDLLNLLIKRLLRTQPQIKLIVMSATLQSSLFQKYFDFDAGSATVPTPGRVRDADKEPIFVGVRRFPVEQIFLDDLTARIPVLRNSVGKQLARAMRSFEDATITMSRARAELIGSAAKGGAAAAAAAAAAVAAQRAEFFSKPEFSYDAQAVLIQIISQMAACGTCILVFLPGLAEITVLQDQLELLPSRVPLRVLALHSIVPRAMQEENMAPPPPDQCKVILSTNIAESSVTIPDVHLVLDAGLFRGIFYDDKLKMPGLRAGWCSQASVRQRAGRTGRVAPGRVVCMYTRRFHDECMPAHDEAELMRVPLEQTVLRVKLLLSQLGSVSALLAEAITAPPPDRVTSAISTLYQVGALHADDEDAEVTEIGRLAVHLPLDLPLVKLVLLGSAFGCLAESIVISAALSLQDLFTMPSPMFQRDRQLLVDELRHNFASRIKLDAGAYSEPLMYLSVYQAWLGSGRSIAWAKQHSISLSRIKQMDMLVAEVSSTMLGVLNEREATATEIASVEMLLSASRNREPLKRGAANALFTSDSDLLRLILAGACAPTFLQGSVKHGNKAEKPIKQAKLDPARTVKLSKVPVSLCSPKALATLLSSLGKVERVDILAAGKGGGEALVQFAADNESVSAASDRLRPMANDACNAVKLLYHVFHASRQKLILPNPQATVGSSEPAEITLPSVSSLNQLDWRVGSSAIQVFINFRSAISAMCELDEREPHRFAVALSLLGTESDTRVRATGVTLLPAGLFGKLLQLIFATSDASVRVQVHPASREIHAVSLGVSMIAFKPHVLSVAQWAAVNLVRRIISEAINGNARHATSATHTAQVESCLRLLVRPPAPADQPEEDEDEEKASRRKRVALEWCECAFSAGSGAEYLPQLDIKVRTHPHAYTRTHSHRHARARARKLTHRGGDVGLSP